MKTLVLMSSLLCIGLGVVTVAQDSSNAAPLRHQVVGLRLTSIMGTVREGDKLTFVTDRRAWNVDNPEMLKGYEGHYVRVIAQVYPDQGWIHIAEVKMATAMESRKNNEQ